ncbi:hypothetical protein A0H81_13509 [Grifola frondosa]|uniref:DUF6535 domain-containing protein n=1 Tax=Grifola frondosa TaxID=5627 RepID=A0A1C7LRN7_GRIFR|nr:hypothetical protein A0H81_13509 [Grifola frondosa]
MDNVQKQDVDTDEATVAWRRCAEVLHDNNKSLLQGWKDEIDTLLVFAGLFSAVLTAFNAQSYQLLQPDPADASVALLMQISMQLNSFTVNPSFINSTHPASLNPQTAFQVPSYAVRVNILWFSSLILSLSSASIGILVKQWLNQYSHGLIGTSHSRETARLHQYRYESLVKWRVLAILTLLPLLLQTALSLFLVGLVDLLWNIHHAVATAATVLVVVLLLFSTFTIILPSFSRDCFYKSPQALGFFLLLQQVLRMWRASYRIMSSVLCCVISDTLPPMGRTYYSWREQERESVRDLESVLDFHILTACDAIKMDDDFLEKTVEPCFRTVAVEVVFPCLENILRHRADDLDHMHKTWTHTRGMRSVNAALSLTLCAFEKLDTGDLRYIEDKQRVSALSMKLWDEIGNVSLQYPVMGRLWITLADMSADEGSFEVMFLFWHRFTHNQDLGPAANDVLPPLNSFIRAALKHRAYAPAVLNLCLAGLEVVTSENLLSRDDEEIYNQAQQILSSLQECLRATQSSRFISMLLISHITRVPSAVLRVVQTIPALTAALVDLNAVLREKVHALVRELSDGSLSNLAVHREDVFHELSVLEAALNLNAPPQRPGSEREGEQLDSASPRPDQGMKMTSSCR